MRKSAGKTWLRRRGRGSRGYVVLARLTKNGQGKKAVEKISRQADGGRLGVAAGVTSAENGAKGLTWMSRPGEWGARTDFGFLVFGREAGPLPELVVHFAHFARASTGQHVPVLSASHVDSPAAARGRRRPKDPQVCYYVVGDINMYGVPEGSRGEAYMECSSRSIDYCDVAPTCCGCS